MKALIKKETEERRIQLTEKEKAEVDRFLASEKPSPAILTTTGIEGIDIPQYTIRFLFEEEGYETW